MLSHISWSQYFTYLLILAIIYYLFIWIVFFKARLSVLPGLSRIRTSMHGSNYVEDAPDELMTTAQQVINEIRPLFKADVIREELFFSLQLSLEKYKGWEEPGFRETINQFIARASATTCSIRLSEDELRALWK